MRKVFVSSILLGKVNPTEYISDDLELGSKHYDFPLSYMIDSEVNENDSVEIITVVERSEEGHQQAAENYELFKKEVNSILQGRNTVINFTEITASKKFESTTFNRFFKEIANEIRDDDKIYMDITFGLKPYTMSMFIAIAYAAKVCSGVSVETVLYSQKYTGTSDSSSVDTAKLYDITALFYINSLAGKAAPNQKQNLDELLNFIID